METIVHEKLTSILEDSHAKFLKVWDPWISYNTHLGIDRSLLSMWRLLWLPVSLLTDGPRGFFSQTFLSPFSSPLLLQVGILSTSLLPLVYLTLGFFCLSPPLLFYSCALAMNWCPPTHTHTHTYTHTHILLKLQYIIRTMGHSSSELLLFFTSCAKLRILILL